MPFNTYKICASIVTFNSELGEVKDAAQSFLTVAVPSRLVIVDNASKQGYFTKLKELGLNAELIQSRRNGGFGFGHNIAIERAPACEYYLVLNPDVIIHPGSLEALLNFMDNNKDIGLVSPRIRNEDGSVQYLNKRLPTLLDLTVRRFFPSSVQNLATIKRRMDRYVMKDIGYDSVYTVPYMTGSFMLFRKTILDAVGSFDENIFLYLEDADMTIRVNKISRAVYFPGADVTHKWARKSHTNLWLTIINIRSAIYFFKKWGLRWW